MPERADVLLAALGYAKSRTQAASLIKSGLVSVNGKTVSKPSEMGAMPGMMTNPVSASTMAAASPTVTTATTSLPNTSKPLTMAFSARHSPRAISAPMMTMGIRLRSTIPMGNPAVRPPARTPSGMVTMPQRIPFAMTGLSFSSRIPIATGMVNTTVAPSMEPVSTPPSMAA